MVRRTDLPAMTIAVDLGRKATKQTNKTDIVFSKGYFWHKHGIHYLKVNLGSILSTSEDINYTP